MIFEWNCWRSRTMLVDLSRNAIPEHLSLHLNVKGMNHTDTGSVLVSIRPLSIQPDVFFSLHFIKAKDMTSVRASLQWLWSNCYSLSPPQKKIHNINSSSRVSDLLICCASHPSGTLSLPPLLWNAMRLWRAGKWMFNAAVCRQRSCWMKGRLFGDQPAVCVAPDDTTQWDLIRRLCGGIPVVRRYVGWKVFRQISEVTKANTFPCVWSHQE